MSAIGNAKDTVDTNVSVRQAPPQEVNHLGRCWRRLPSGQTAGMAAGIFIWGLFVVEISNQFTRGAPRGEREFMNNIAVVTLVVPLVMLMGLRMALQQSQND